MDGYCLGAINTFVQIWYWSTFPSQEQPMERPNLTPPLRLPTDVAHRRKPHLPNSLLSQMPSR